MPTALPLNEFVISTDAVVLADSSGIVRLLSGPASALLGCDPVDVIGKPCWETMRLRRLDGKKLCSRRCLVQRSFLTDQNCVKQEAVRISPDGTKQPLDLLSLKIPPVSNGRYGVLHVIVPARSERDSVSPPTYQWCSEYVGRLEDLTPREAQVLEGLSLGESTASLAASLCISIATVRNHIRTILRKLGVHSRLDAVLIWISRAQKESSKAAPSHLRN